MMCSLRTNNYCRHDSSADITSYIPAPTSTQRFHRGIYVLCSAVAVTAGNLDVHAMFAYYMFYATQYMLLVA
jgi:hypothetical protein